MEEGLALAVPESRPGRNTLGPFGLLELDRVTLEKGIEGVLFSVCSHALNAMTVKRIDAGLPGTTTMTGALSCCWSICCMVSHCAPGFGRGPGCLPTGLCRSRVERYGEPVSTIGAKYERALSRRTCSAISAGRSASQCR